MNPMHVINLKGVVFDPSDLVSPIRRTTAYAPIEERKMLNFLEKKTAAEEAIENEDWSEAGDLATQKKYRLQDLLAPQYQCDIETDDDGDEFEEWKERCNALQLNFMNASPATITCDEDWSEENIIHKLIFGRTIQDSLA